VHRLEEALLRTLASFGLTGHRVRGAPGIYVRLADPFDHARLPPPQPGQDAFAGLAKIAALGVKITRSHAYHGLALNVAMDLEPFSRINPCGYAGLRTTDLRALGVAASRDEAAARLASELQRLLQAR
jgi:lipoyl(octanoyl) transferase